MHRAVEEILRGVIFSRNFLIGGGFTALLAGLAVGQIVLNKSEAQGVMAPKFEVDPLWPKPLPNHWVLGSVIGVWVDADDNIWIIQRPGSLGIHENQLDTKLGDCCAAAPPVLEFDQAGNLLEHWGGPGPGYDWPTSNHGIFVDYKGFVWIGGNGAGDSQILKFTKDGKFVAQYGKPNARVAPCPTEANAATNAEVDGAATGRTPGAGGRTPRVCYAGGSNDPNNFGRVAKIYVDREDNEAYVADGYLNKRVAVLDADTGKMKRWWGGYGHKPDDTPVPAYDPSQPIDQQFRSPVHCAMMSEDRLVYVCDRVNDRLQVFTPEGKFVKEAFYYRNTRSDGSVWDLAFSKDPQQRYIYMADGVNDKVRIIDRQSLKEITNFGDGGRQPGEFHAVHSIATDHEGNIYTTETYEGKRIQRFVNKGMAPVTKFDQGVLWP